MLSVTGVYISLILKRLRLSVGTLPMASEEHLVHQQPHDRKGIRSGGRGTPRHSSAHALLKLVRTRFITTQNVIAIRLSRYSPITAALIVLLFAFLFLCIVLPPLISSVKRDQASPAQSDAFRLIHLQLDESASHFSPPSLFAPENCVRQFDQAWTIQNTLGHTNSSDSSHRLPRPTSELRERTRKTPVSIAFGIQASGGTVKLLPRLLSRIHHRRNVYVIHIDAKTSEQEISSFLAHVQSKNEYASNVHIIDSEMLTYKGISTVLNTLTLMSTALRKHAEWSYYINLSAGDYPLISPDNLAKLLARPIGVMSGLLNYVWFFPRKEWHPYSFRVRNMYWDPAACGYQSKNARLFYMKGQKRNPLEAYRSYTFTKAEAWAILSRPFITFLTRSSFAKRMLLAHVHVLSVSEHFVTDILFNHPVWRATVVPDAFRLVIWYFRGRRSGQHPYVLDSKDPNDFKFWPFLEDSIAIFARKFTLADSPIMDRIDSEISGASLNQSHPSYEKFRSSRATFYKRLALRFDELTKQTLRQQGYKWLESAFSDL